VEYGPGVLGIGFEGSSSRLYTVRIRIFTSVSALSLSLPPSHPPLTDPSQLPNGKPSPSQLYNANTSDDKMYKYLSLPHIHPL
jgi:hypothetical protein